MKKFKKDTFDSFKKARFSRYRDFRVSFRKSKECSVGCIVTKKAGNAVKRNRIRRIVFEFFRVNNVSYDIFIIVHNTKIEDMTEFENKLKTDLLNLKKRLK